MPRKEQNRNTESMRSLRLIPDQGTSPSFFSPRATIRSAPSGSGRCSDEGHLLRSRAGLLALHMDGGGTWLLDAPRKMLPLVGQRVKVSGTRAGFDLIDVNGFALA